MSLKKFKAHVIINQIAVYNINGQWRAFRTLTYRDIKSAKEKRKILLEDSKLKWPNYTLENTGIID